MSTRSSIRISGRLGLALAVALIAVPAHASKKDDDYRKAQEAVAANDVINAAKYFCAAADADPKYKDAASQCETYTNETKRLRKLDEKRLEDARANIKAGKLDEAEDLLHKIKIADLADQAKDELGKIASLKSQQNAAASAERNFQQAVQTYNSNDFQRAREMFAAITGAHAAEARDYLTTPPATSASAAPPRTTAPAPVPERAIRQETARVDVPKMMKEADTAQAKGDVGVAKGKYLAILAAEPGNTSASDALNKLAASSGGHAQAAGAEADAMLSRAIGEYYKSQLEDAYVHARDYLAADGSKRGLAYFYQGASKLTLYYLSGAQDRQLFEDARAAFLKAKQVANFHPPDKLISPRILKAYTEAR
jgi:hypothetical protein